MTTNPAQPSLPKKYRKKPVVVFAVQYDGDNGSKIFQHFLGYLSVYNDHLDIDTLEGRMRANIGDWIIQGFNGEIYPCKPDIFEKTYEAVESAQTELPNSEDELDELTYTYLHLARNERGGQLSEIHEQFKAAINKWNESKVLEARQEQDRHSRGDEFLWIMRKLSEYMYGSTSSRYKAFRESMESHEAKYKEYFKKKAELTSKRGKA